MFGCLTLTSTFSDLSDIGSLFTSIFFKRDEAAMEALEFKMKNFKRNA